MARGHVRTLPATTRTAVVLGGDGRAAPSRRRGCEGRGCEGFTLAETLVVIGLLVALAGLLLPALNTAKQRSREVVRLDDARGYVVGVTLYADGNNGRTPAFEGRMIKSVMARGHEPLLRIGVYKSPEQFDRVGWELLGRPSFLTASALLAPPGAFDPARPDHYASDEAVGAVLAVAASPSQKGALHQSQTSRAVMTTWCCGDLATRGVVAFLDGRAEYRAVSEFELPEIIPADSGIGWPILSTPKGLRGVDRLRN